MIGPLMRMLIKIYGPTIAKSIFTAAKNVINKSEGQALKDFSTMFAKKQELRKMTKDEAKKILGVTSNNPADLDFQYKKLFSLNDPARGGSFYLQCKVLGAYEAMTKGK